MKFIKILPALLAGSMWCAQSCSEDSAEINQELPYLVSTTPEDGDQSVSYKTKELIVVYSSGIGENTSFSKKPSITNATIESRKCYGGLLTLRVDTLYPDMEYTLSIPDGYLVDTYRREIKGTTVSFKTQVANADDK